MVGLGDLPGGDFAGGALCASADGSVIAGTSTSGAGIDAFRWTQATGMLSLGGLASGWRNCLATGISANGQIIVGYGSSSRSGNGREGFCWSAAHGLVGLGDLPGGEFESSAFGVSADGSVIVGVSVSSNGYEAFSWTESTGLVALGDLPGGSFASSASAVSPDGTIVVGGGSSGAQEAYRWTALNGMVPLGFAPGDHRSNPYAVSADGNTIVGGNESGEALIWQPQFGMRHLREVLTQDYQLDLTGWRLSVARGVSADGSKIVGYGFNPSGDWEAWLANLAPPAITCNHLGNQLLLSWDTNAVGFVLEQATSVGSPETWNRLFLPISVVGGRNVVTQEITQASSFYRLRKL
jgi:probable HAF family extracellular repeat protein